MGFKFHHIIKPPKIVINSIQEMSDNNLLKYYDMAIAIMNSNLPYCTSDSAIIWLGVNESQQVIAEMDRRTAPNDRHQTHN